MTYLLLPSCSLFWTCAKPVQPRERHRQMIHIAIIIVIIIIIIIIIIIATKTSDQNDVVARVSLPYSSSSKNASGARLCCDAFGHD